MSRLVIAAWGLALLVAVPCSAAEPASPAALRGLWKIDKQPLMDGAIASPEFKAFTAEQQKKAREELVRAAAVIPDTPFLEVTDKKLIVIQADGKRVEADYTVKSVEGRTLTLAKTVEGGESADVTIRMPDDGHLLMVAFLPDGGDMPLVRVEAGPRKK